VRIFRVWDEINSEESEARVIEASTPEEAARRYADEDVDGWTDGLYHDHSHPIVVTSDGGLERWRVEVQAEMVPHMRAVSAVQISKDET
jgi:hypothetical protein